MLIPTNRRFRAFLPLASFCAALSFAAAVHADDDANRDLIKDAHHQLAAALNMGGDPPSDADRTKDLTAALSDLKDMTFVLGRVIRAQNMAERHIQAALNAISRGDADKLAEKEIRDADSLVRDLEA